MNYQGSLMKKEREQIFRLFLESTVLRFNQIKKSLEIGSNKVAYHIERMQKEGLLEKNGNLYYLSKTAEKYLPIISNITGQKISPIPVILVEISIFF